MLFGRWELKNRLHILEEEPEMNIDSFNQILKEAGDMVLGFKKRRRRNVYEGRPERKEKQGKNSSSTEMNSAQSERVRDQLRRKLLRIGPRGEKHDQTRQEEV